MGLMLSVLDVLAYWIAVLQRCFSLRADIINDLDASEAEKHGTTWHWDGKLS
jgi:hypothetical protein